MFQIITISFLSILSLLILYICLELFGPSWSTKGTDSFGDPIQNPGPEYDSMENLFFAFVMTLNIFMNFTVMLALTVVPALVFRTVSSRWFGSSLKFLQWFLPIEKFPLRSVGIVSGTIVFLFISIWGMMTYALLRAA